MKTAESRTKSGLRSVNSLFPNKRDTEIFFTPTLADKTGFIGPKVIKPKLEVDPLDDEYEREADQVADAVLMTQVQERVKIQRKCKGCEEEEKKLQRKEGSRSISPGSLSLVNEVLNSPTGKPLDSEIRAFMEPRFGYDFSGVRIHDDYKAAESATKINALAYTSGNNIIFNKGQYSSETENGKRLLAHELTHVVQQNHVSLPPVRVQRQYGVGLGDSGNDADVVAERKYASSGAPKAHKCGSPSWCPSGFCDPYPSEKLAEYYRAKKSWWLMAGISAFVNSRVVPLWREYLWGGSSPKDLSTDFGTDFTNSPTTKKTTEFLYNELKKVLVTQKPSVPLYTTISLDLATQIPRAVSELGDPKSTNQMNFNIPKDIPGNLAGGIGKDQLTCPAGAKPSPFNDERKANGTVIVTRLSARELTVTPIINYTVKDTIDLCPGDCGTWLEQIATVPLSQFEATGISGDVPFTVNFPAPFLGQFKVSVPTATK